jgi:hypothetical protein
MIDTTQVPQYIIDCSTLTHAREIRQEMREAGVRLYCYAFTFKSEILKFGEQHKWDPTTYGERIYRQAWHIPGWPTTPKSSSGSDMLDIIQNFPNINKNDICIMIWDMTNYPQASLANTSFEVRALERQLIKAYIDEHGKKPVGNIKDEEHMDRKTRVRTDLFDALFHSG